MAMQIHDLVQGSPEWHEWRTKFLMASDAPAMMGVSPYKSRNELLQEKKFGISREVNSFLQKRFDDGHRFEALARPYAEKFLGEELYPICGSNGIYGASLDGMTLAMSINWEHKSMNDGIRAAQTADDLPMVYHIQIAQQFLVSGAERTLFSATKFNEKDELVEEKHLWVERNEALIESVKAGWAQFDCDLEVYVPPQEAPVVVGKAPDALPALRIEVTGMVQHSNLAEFTEHALTVFRGIKTELLTDEDFANAEKTAAWCKDVESRLDAAKQHALSQTDTIDALFRAIDSIKEEARQKRLNLEKQVKTQKESIKANIVSDAKTALQDHINAINQSLGGNWMPKIDGNFAEAAKNKRTLSSLRGAVNDALASAKTDAALIHTTIAANRAYVGEEMHLFPDFASVCTTAPNIFVDILASRRATLAANAKLIEAAKSAVTTNEPPSEITITEPVVPFIGHAPATAGELVGLVAPMLSPVFDSANDIPAEFGGNVDPIIQAESEVSAFLKSREWKNQADRNHARAICIEFAKFQSGYRKAA